MIRLCSFLPYINLIHVVVFGRKRLACSGHSISTILPGSLRISSNSSARRCSGFFNRYASMWNTFANFFFAPRGAPPNLCRRINTNVGLATRFFDPNPLTNPCVKVVFPAPRFPCRANTAAFFLLGPLFIKDRAISYPNFFVSAEEKVRYVSVFLDNINKE